MRSLQPQRKQIEKNNEKKPKKNKTFAKLGKVAKARM
jgi:hypothetical protein